MATAENSETKIFKGNVLVIGAHPDDEAGFYVGAISEIARTDPDRAFVISATLGRASTVGQGTANNGERLDEFTQCLNYLGLPESNQLHLDLSDGELHKPENVRKLTKKIEELANEFDISSFVTPGWQGVDGHSDHRAAHISGVLAAWHLRKERSIEVWGLDTKSHGDLVITDFEEEKRKALLHHASQFPNERSIKHLVNTSPIYAGLMEKEAYKRSDSSLDVARAAFRLVVPYRQNIPRT